MRYLAVALVLVAVVSMSGCKTHQVGGVTIYPVDIWPFDEPSDGLSSRPVMTPEQIEDEYDYYAGQAAGVYNR